MSGRHRCQNLNTFSDICDIAPCIEEVKGLASGSASPTDTWLLTLRKGANYDGFPLQKAFLKFHVNYRSLRGLPQVVRERDLLPLYGLEYEIKLYRDIIKPMIDQSICPNFLLFLGSGQNCELSNLMDMLAVNVHGDPTSAESQREFQRYTKRFERNLLYMVNRESNRPSISTDENLELVLTTPPTVRISPNEMWNYNILMTHQIKADTLQEFLLTQHEHSPTLWQVLFQVGAACFAMSLAHMTHNDLHLGNVWVKKISAPRNLLYVYDHTYYRLTSVQYKAIIYDFDRSYSEVLGTNVLIQGGQCSKGSQCNEYVPNKDIIKMFRYIFVQASPSMKSNILNILCPSERAKIFLSSVYTHGSFLQVPGRDGGISMEEFRTLFYPMNRILKNIFQIGHRVSAAAMSILPSLVGATSSKLAELEFDKNGVFVCNRSFFAANGNIHSVNRSQLLMKDILFTNQQREQGPPQFFGLNVR